MNKDYIVTPQTKKEWIRIISILNRKGFRRRKMSNHTTLFTNFDMYYTNITLKNPS